MRLLFCLALLFLSGCASLGPQFSELRAKSKSQAVVYVYRPKAFTGSARSPDIVVNGTKIGEIPNGGYFSSEVAPGSSQFVMRNFANEETGAFSVDLKPNQIYFLRVDLSLPTLTEHYSVEGKNTGEKCPFNGVNIMLPPSQEEMAQVAKQMDTRLQKTTCVMGFLFVNEQFAKQELSQTKLANVKR